jgi:hypothetical protein
MVTKIPFHAILKTSKKANTTTTKMRELNKPVIPLKQVVTRMSKQVPTTTKKTKELKPPVQITKEKVSNKALNQVITVHSPYKDL